VRTNIGSSHDLNNAIAVQSDGKIILAGLSNAVDPDGAAASSNQSALVRYLPDGSLDNSFGGNGKLITAMSPESDYITCLAIQPDGKIVAAGTTKNYNYDFSIARYNPDGSLDSSFDGDGKVFTPIPGGAVPGGSVSCMAIQPNGKIVVAGANGLPNINVIRYNTDGSLDNSFDSDGIRTINIGGGGVSSIAIQSDGKIVLAGSAVMIRLNSDGSLDNSFDGDGKLTTAIGGSISLAILNDGKILVAGSYNSDFGIAKYNGNGTIDNSFDGDGMVTTDLGGNEGITSITIQTDGKILVFGSGTLVRYNNNGSLDSSFDGDGKFYVGSGAYMAQYSNRIYLSGNIQTEGESDFSLVAVLNNALNSALPLRLLDFSGKLPNEDALLNWKTENESNTLEFIVERSTDGRNYIPVGSVNSLNNAGTNYYNFTDYNVKFLGASILYYRLKQTDIDGHFTYSRIIALPLDKNKNIVLLYPNPVINEVNLAITVNRPEKVQVRITDNRGSVVKQQQWSAAAGSTSLSIDVQNLAKGMYYLEIKGESINYIKQFVK
jgi:uncharacterized delta-60 repeat protein